MGREHKTTEGVEARPDADATVRIPALRRTGLRNPVVYVLLLAGIGDAATGNPIDALLLLGVGIALARGTPEPSPAGSEKAADGARRFWPVVPVGVLAAAAFALLVAGLEWQSWPATVALAIPGAIALALAFRMPLRESAPLSRRAVALWAGVFIAIGLWEAANLLMQPSLLQGSHDHPTLSVLAKPFLATYGGRSLALFAWVGLGWYLIKR
jgi:hypothetical protein